MNIKRAISLALVFFLTIACQSNEDMLEQAEQLVKHDKYAEAIALYTKVISNNDKLQLAYYNRGIAYFDIKQYKNALFDFDKVISLQFVGDIRITWNQDSPLPGEEARLQVPYTAALYQRAQVKYFMDSLRSSFTDFESLIKKEYQKSSCLLWQGTLFIGADKAQKACVYFYSAKEFALTNEERTDADKMINAYCK